jgi:hypothetical protein
MDVFDEYTKTGNLDVYKNKIFILEKMFYFFGS